MSTPALLHALWESNSTGAAVARGALTPLELGYRLASAADRWSHTRGLRRVHTVPAPVISVGNLRVGGAGKTPFTRWVIEQLLALGRKPAVLHGGYADDEPALHRAWHTDVPVYAQRERARSARHAIANGADTLVLDDGFQHYALGRDLDIVLVAAERWREKPHLLPAGAWREPPRALQRADLVVVTRRTADTRHAFAVQRAVSAIAPRAAAAAVHIAPVRWADWRTRIAVPAPRGVLVAGIAEPDLFEQNARSTGAQLTGRHFFRDHHEYSADDVRRLGNTNVILTTEKDAVKLAELATDTQLLVLEQEIIFDSGEDIVRAALREALA